MAIYKFNLDRLNNKWRLIQFMILIIKTFQILIKYVKSSNHIA